MIPISTITPKACDLIKCQLKALEKKHNIRILFAIESGSRAWGFPSINSDYDVRFVYARSKKDYFSIMQHRDVLETEIMHSTELDVLLDMNGWDIRKALMLAIKSNAVLIEWLQSPIKYYEDEAIVNDLIKFVHKTVNIDQLKAHYYKLMHYAWNEIEQSGSRVKIKLYCYALRPALALVWLNRLNKIPPMDIRSLYSGLGNLLDLEKDIANIIALKATACEQDIIARNYKIDTFITSISQYSLNDLKKIVIDKKYITKADTFFRRILTK